MMVDIKNSYADVNKIFTTDGGGYWSNKIKSVKCLHMMINYINEEKDFGELILIFDTKSWNINIDGLIYTDKTFEEQFKEYLKSIDLFGDDVNYSEQGMQGTNYVSFDIGENFINSWETKMRMDREKSVDIPES